MLCNGTDLNGTGCMICNSELFDIGHVLFGDESVLDLIMFPAAVGPMLLTVHAVVVNVIFSWMKAKEVCLLQYLVALRPFSLSPLNLQSGNL